MFILVCDVCFVYFVFTDYVMGESTCTLTLIDVADALQAKYAFISGQYLLLTWLKIKNELFLHKALN